MKVEPSQPTFRWEDQGGRVRLTLTARRNWFVLLFLSAWLVGWGVGEFMVPTQMLGKSGRTGIDLFAVAWLVGWTLGGGFALYIWLWNLIGREIIEIDSESLRIKRAVGSVGPLREFSLGHVRALRVAPVGFSPFDFASGMRFWGVGGGSIAFDYGAKTYRFGSALDEAEAKQVLARIGDRLPREVLA